MKQTGNEMRCFFRRRTIYTCPKDCPRRSATCHAECKEYLAAWEQQRKEREEIAAKGKLNDEITQYKEAMYGKIERHLRNRKHK